jgi:hypothetical protein
MKRFTPANAHLRVAVPAVGMLKLLQERKAMIAEKHRAARGNGTAADVSMLSASLRQVKASLKAAMGGR